MSLRERCYITGLTLSARSEHALKMISYKVDLANQLSALVIASPLIDIFSGRRATLSQTSKEIYTYHWDDLAQAFGAINPILRREVYNIAAQEEYFSHGKEQRFWKCVTSAAL
ncbi:hypothetical protein [Vibrio sp. TBV020]|uniref:hypothetical protein n=1 Tax=Vibrio sp. TBV020 TaxID=3137398 RepID=UPI0038CD76C0